MDWDIGDIAICINDQWYYLNGGPPPDVKHPKKGQSYMVTSIFPLHDRVFLALVGMGDSIWDSVSFTKQNDPPEERTRKQSAPKELEVV